MFQESNNRSRGGEPEASPREDDEPVHKEKRRHGDEVAVGAFVVPLPLVQAVRQSLKRERWLKSGVCVSPAPSTDGASSEQRNMAVHLNHKGVLELARHLGGEKGSGSSRTEIDPEADPPAAIPRDIWSKIADGSVAFAPGLRLGAQVHGARSGGGAKASTDTYPGAAPSTAAAAEAEAPTSRFAFIELFAGIGGFRCALEAIGGSCRFASEIDQAARDIYRLNFADTDLLVGDITEVNSQEVPPHDLLTAGFCCQSFSRAGDENGLDDSRGILFYEVVRVLRNSRPSMVLLENVSNLLPHDGGNTIGTILDLLRGAGYLITFRVINSGTLLPQHRQRIYLVGFREDLRSSFDAFRWPAMPLLDRCVRDILETDCDTTKDCNLSDHQWAKIQDSAIFKEDPGRRMAMLDGCARTLMASYKRGYYMHSEFVFGDEAANITKTDNAGGCGSSVPPGPPRFYTPRECARLMGFPEDFRGLGSNRAYHHLGNAVCPPIVAGIAEAMLRAFEQGESKGDCCSPRGHVLEPALRLLEAASPLAQVSPPSGHTRSANKDPLLPQRSGPGNDQQGAAASGRPSLHDQVEAFLSAEMNTDDQSGVPAGTGSLPCHTGYSTNAEEGGGLASISELLGSPVLKAQMAALRDLARLSSKSGLDMAPRNRKLIVKHPKILGRLLELAAGAGDSNGGQTTSSGHGEDSPGSTRHIPQEDRTGEGSAIPSSLPMLAGAMSVATASAAGADGDDGCAGVERTKDQRGRGMAIELQRLALVAITNLAAGRNVTDELKAAGAQSVLSGIAQQPSNDSGGGTNLQSQAQTALEMMTQGSGGP